MKVIEFILNEKTKLMIISLIVNGILIISIVCLFVFNKKSNTILNSSLDNDKVVLNSKEDNSLVGEDDKKIYIDIKGSVKKPGVYLVDSKSIINNVVLLAGGFSKDAYTKNINLSKRVTNEMVIYIYSKSEFYKLSQVNNEKQNECVCDDYNIDKCINNGNSVIISSDEKLDNNSNNNENVTDNVNDENSNKNEVVNENNKKININTASINELTSLNGIGESKAKLIIEYRSKNPFKSIEEIKNVSGIGDKAYEKIKDYITV